MEHIIVMAHPLHRIDRLATSQTNLFASFYFDEKQNVDHSLSRGNLLHIPY
jgi:hypothetical protein